MYDRINIICFDNQTIKVGNFFEFETQSQIQNFSKNQKKSKNVDNYVDKSVDNYIYFVDNSRFI